MNPGHIAVLTLALVAGPLRCSPVSWTFEGLADSEQVLAFYNGGSGGAGSTSGQWSGVWFGPGLVGLVDRDAGGTGNFAKPPSGITVLGFAGTAGAYLEAQPGLSLSAVSFYYTPPGHSLSIHLYSGAGATGTLVQTLVLSGSRDSCGVDPAAEFSCWVYFTTMLPPGVQSLSFSTWIGSALLDDMSVQTATALPEPPSGTLLVLGAAAFLGSSMRPKRDRSQQPAEHH